MRQWEHGGIPCAPDLFLLPAPGSRPPAAGNICRTSESAQESGPEDRTLHAAKHRPLRTLDNALQSTGADGGKSEVPASRLHTKTESKNA